MKWKSLKRGLAVFLSALMITSSVPVHAEESDPQEQTEVNISEESTEGGESNSAERSKPVEESEPAAPKESESTGESATVEESESTRESTTEEESESTEESTTEEESELTEESTTEESESTEESTTEEESESTEESTTEEESESTEESTTEEESKSTEESTTEEESESTGESTTEEESESTEDFTTEESTVEETTEEETTEIETETETETETAEVIAFADIEDVVTFNTGNMEISVIPSDDYSDDLFEACLDENIFVQPFEEDGSFTIEAEADAFFPYEVQFQYDGSTENKWFMNPDDSVDVSGHMFYIHSEFSGDVVTQMNLSAAGKTVTVYPEEKEFTNDGGISTYSLMPLEERNLTVDLTGLNPLQLTRVAVSSVFAGENSISAEKLAWSINWGDDNYKVNSTGDVIDLSYYSCYGGHSWEMIVGDADQLNSSNIRYLMTINTDRTDNWLNPIVCKQNDDGSLTGNLVSSAEYRDYSSSREDDWDWSRYEQIYLSGSSITSNDVFYLKFDKNVFGSDSIKVYEGELNSPDEAGQAKEITSDIFDGQGYQLPFDGQGYNRDRYITLISYENDTVKGFLPLEIRIYSDNERFSFDIQNEKNENCDYTYSSRIENNCEFQTYKLFKGYSAEQQYNLKASHYQNGSGNPDIIAYKGLYNTLEEAQSSGAEEVTSAILGTGYLSNYNQGVDFTFFVNDKIFRYNVKVEEGDVAANEYFTFSIRDENRQTCNYTYSGENNYELQTYELYKGYPADQQYYLQVSSHYINNSGTWGSSAASGVTVYKGSYTTLEEAQGSSAEDVTTAIFGDGYLGSYSQGVDFTFFTSDKVIHHNVKVVEGEQEKSKYLSSNSKISFSGFVDANGSFVKAYSVAAREDSYAEYNFLTILVDKDVDLTNLALRFSTYDSKAKVYCEGSSSPEESGKSYHDYSKGIMQYTVSAENGEDATNYWVQVVKSDASNANLYINSLRDPSAKTEIRDGVAYTTREIVIDDFHDNVHDILLANMGDTPVSKISVELDSNVVALDSYWTLSGSQDLGTFDSTQINDDKIYGELSNLAKIRLKQKEGVADGTEVTGTLKIQEDGKDLIVMTLTGTVGDPTITTTEIPSTVKYVPYGTMIQNSNKYSQNKVSYSLQLGTLPEGMILKPNGEIYGVPKETGTFHIGVRMENSISNFASSTKEFDLTVLDNTDENVNNATDEGYTLSTRLSRIESSSDFIVVSEGVLPNFKYVYIDGDQLIEGVDYDAESGSTRITIRSETLSKKGSGVHTLGIEFREGGEETGELKRAAQNYDTENIGFVTKPSDSGSDSGNNGSDSSDSGNNGSGSSDSGNNGSDSSDSGNNGSDSSDSGNNGSGSSDSGNNGSGNSNSGNNSSNNNSSSSSSSNSSSNSNVTTAAKADNTSVEIVPVEGFVYKEGYTMSQTNVSQNHILRAALLNQYYGQNMYLNVVFGADFGLTIDMAGVPMVENDVEIAYTFVSDPIIAPEFDVIHAIPNAIKPLGFEAVFNFHIGDTYIGKKAYIYVLNESGTGYDFIGETIVNEIGNIAFTSRNVTDVIIFVEK